MEEPRYNADRIDDREWIIQGERTERRRRREYLMYFEPVSGSSLHNYQLVLVRCTRDASMFSSFIVFDQEMYSVMFYSTDPETFAEGVIEVLQSSLIDNPVELALAFGGTVRGNSVHGVRVPGLH